MFFDLLGHRQEKQMLRAKIAELQTELTHARFEIADYQRRLAYAEHIAKQNKPSE